MYVVFYYQVGKDTFFAIILASNYLDISPLLDTCCRHMANLIKGKTVDEIRKILKIIPPEEKQQSSEDAKDDEISTMEVENETKPNSDDSGHENALPACLAESS